MEIFERFRQMCNKKCCNRKINLRDINLGLNSSSVIKKILMTNTNIAHLDLALNHIGDDGVSLLAQFLDTGVRQDQLTENQSSSQIDLDALKSSQS